jgi:hypothetical protein
MSVFVALYLHLPFRVTSALFCSSVSFAVISSFCQVNLLHCAPVHFETERWQVIVH